MLNWGWYIWYWFLKEALLNLGRYPGLVENGKTAVTGEIYEVDTATIAILDEYEEHPVEYIRTTILLADGSHAETYIFQTQGKTYPIISSGDWLTVS